MYPNGGCPNCGGKLHGDGFNTVLHCENAEEEAYWYAEPDSRPVYCAPADQVRPWWDHVEPAKVVPQSPLEQAHVLPARYHRSGQYHTNRPEMPLWKQVRDSIRGAAPPQIDKSGTGWTVEYIVITSEELARRVAALFVKHRPEETCLRFHLMRRTGLHLSPLDQHEKALLSD